MVILMEGNLSKITYGLLIAVILVMMFNSYNLTGMMGAMSATGMNTANMNAVSANAVAAPKPAAQSALSGPDVIPKGVPAIYGAELGVSYDDISVSDQKKADATINKIGVLDKKLSVKGADKERYIKITSQISCEYCCGVESIIFENGEAACGCAHSFAMRGLAKYLILNHGTEYTDDQVLEELGKWKTLFFPGAITKKAAVLQSQGIELNYINLASNKYRGAEQGAAAGQMVGGC